MRERRIEVEDELLVVTGMVVSDRVLRELEPLYRPEFLEGAWSRRVAGWAWEHWRAYRRAPGRHIQDIHAQAVADGVLPDAEAELVAAFLSRLSDQWVDGGAALNEDYLLDVAERRFGRRAIVSLTEELRDAVARGALDEAEAAVAGWRRPVRSRSDGANPLTDEELVRAAFEDGTEPLFRYAGPLGTLVNDLMVPEAFIAIMAPEKRGKSWWLMDIAVQALKAGNNVALFSTGDMSLRQLALRLHVRLSGRSNREKYCGAFLVPTLDCRRNQAGTCPLRRRGRPGLAPAVEGGNPLDRAPAGYEACSWCARERHGEFRGAPWWRERAAVEPLTWRQGLRIAKTFSRHCRGRTLRLEAHPAGTLTLDAVRRRLDTWERRDGWVPGVIVTDYADIMDEPGESEHRHKQNRIFIGHRALSMERRALVLTGTQSDADSYTAHTIGLRNFTEDKRKYAHVTAILTLNQLAWEKRLGLMRVGVLLAREEDFDGGATVNVLCAPRMGRPVLGSYW